ncbi:adenylyl-sulfate kinase [Trichocoleus sp. FACHB-262]|uniref:adenylyl-sulfate kinase n=1 Tax=Trichocoleus sp. FACHB-262 TaxID=2692869 RepID=UPI0016842846|nr:adenylyl-sulfate kinase [Trichocoleus sp. FACHB-262]MBD2121680.1 adenylyl-sulfate kinase [Trichocoleus sp. FACHB-262]
MSNNSFLKDTGVILWLTGISGAGKTTISRHLEHKLQEYDRLVELLDGDVIRQNLSKELSFSREDRNTNVRRVGYVANLLSRNGVIVIVALISPYRSVRDELRSTLNNFVEIYVNASLEVCEARDVKGLYAKARSGQIPLFTGIDDPYEVPLNPNITCYTAEETVDESTNKIVIWLESMGYLQRPKIRQ